MERETCARCGLPFLEGEVKTRRMGEDGRRHLTQTCVDRLRAALARARNDALEEAARAATGFLVGDPANGVPLRNPMAHEIAERIRALKSKEPQS